MYGLAARLAALAASMFIFIFIGAAAAGLARAQETAAAQRVVEGVIVNGTAGADGASAGGQTVTLHRVGADGGQDLSAESDHDGAFRFEFEYDPDLAYGVSVRYQDAVYGTDLDLSDGSPDPVELTVYESTSDDGVIRARSASILLAAADPSDQTVAALEIVRLVNDTDTAYVPGEGVMELLRFGLPPGATGLTLDTRLIGADFIQVDRGFALLASVPPGEYDVMFSYRFPYESDEFTLSKTYRYGADSLRALAAEEVMSIESAELGEPKTERIGERQYRILEAEGFTRGAAVSIRLSGLPAPDAADRVGASLDGIRFEYAAPAALALLMAGLLIYGAIWRSGARSAAASAPASSAPAAVSDFAESESARAMSAPAAVSDSGESESARADSESAPDSPESESARADAEPDPDSSESESARAMSAPAPAVSDSPETESARATSSPAVSDSPESESTRAESDSDPDSGESESAVVRAMIADLYAAYEAGSISRADYLRRLKILDSRLGGADEGDCG